MLEVLGYIPEAVSCSIILLSCNQPAAHMPRCTSHTPAERRLAQVPPSGKVIEHAYTCSSATCIPPWWPPPSASRLDQIRPGTDGMWGVGYACGKPVEDLHKVRACKSTDQPLSLDITAIHRGMKAICTSVGICIRLHESIDGPGLWWHHSFVLSQRRRRPSICVTWESG